MLEVHMICIWRNDDDYDVSDVVAADADNNNNADIDRINIIPECMRRIDICKIYLTEPN